MRQDAVFLEAPEGVYVRDGQSSFVLRGRSAYRWVTALLPYLDGAHSVEQICAGLPSAQRDTVLGLLGALQERGVVRHSEPVVDVPDPAVDDYAEQVAFLAHYGDDAAAAFLRFRQSRIAVVGDGTLAEALTECLSRNGHGGTTDGIVRVTDGADAQGFSSFGLVCHVPDSADPATTLALAKQARADRVAFLSVTPLPGRLVLGPLVPAHGAEAAACVSCSWLRMHDNGIVGADALWRQVVCGSEPSAYPVPEQMARMAGGILAFEIFKHTSGVVSSELAGAVLSLDLERATTTREVPIQHRSCPACAAYRNASSAGQLVDVVTDTTDESGTDEGEYAAYAPAIAALTGVFTAFTDEPLPQIPVKVARLETPGLPAALAPGGRVFGFSVSTVMQARLAALRSAACGYALHVARTGARRTTLRAATGATGAVPIASLSTWLGTPVLDGDLVMASPLRGGAPLGVPRAAVLASPLTRGADGFEPSLAGLGCGATPAAAAMRAVVSALGATTMASAARGDTAMAPLDLDAHACSDELIFLVRCARAAHPDVTALRAVSGPVQVVVVSAGAGGEPAVAAAGSSIAEALAEALLALVGQHQCPDAAASSAGLLVPGLTARSGWRMAEAAAAALPTARAEPTNLQTLRRELARDGASALLVDLTPDDLRPAGTRVVRALITTTTD